MDQGMRPFRRLHAQTSEESSGESQLRHFVIAALVLAVVYGLTSPDNRFEAEDALSYSAAIEFGEEPSDLISPQHLAYLPFANLIFESSHQLGLVDRSLPLLVWMGAFVAAAACVLFVALLRSWLQVGWGLAIFGGAGLASSYAFWRYAGEAEIYSLAALGAIAMVLGAVRLSPSIPSAVALGALATFAILGHTLNAAVVAATAYLLVKRGWSVRLLAITAMTGVVMLVPSLWVGYQTSLDQDAPTASEAGFIGFYTGEGLVSEVNLGDAIPAIGVIGSLVVASNAVFLYEPTRQLLIDTFPGRALADEIYMGQTAPEWLNWMAPVALAAVLTALVVLLLQLHYPSMVKNVDGRFLLIWIVLYSAIVVLGGAVTQPEVWLLLLVPLWALVVIGLRRRPPSSSFLTIVVLAIAFNSLIGGLMPVYTGQYRQADLTAWLEGNTSESDLVLTADSAGLARYIAYNRPPHAGHIGGRGNPARTLEAISEVATLVSRGATTHEILLRLEDENLLSGHRTIDKANGHLYLTTDFFDPPAWLATAEPEAALMLSDLEGELGPFFEDAPGSDFYLIRSRDR